MNEITYYIVKHISTIENKLFKLSYHGRISHYYTLKQAS